MVCRDALYCPFALIGLSLFWMSTDFYVHHADSSYFHQLGYGETLHGTKCDVLISGDSTAMVGVDPAEIQHRTGLSACNIAEYAGIQLLTGTQILDDFLRKNPRPRYLIFLEAPENYSNSHDWKFVGTLEGVIFRSQDSSVVSDLQTACGPSVGDDRKRRGGALEWAAFVS